VSLPTEPLYSVNDRSDQAENQRIQVAGCCTAELAAEVIGEGVSYLWSHALLGSMAQDLDGGVLAWRDLIDLCRVIRFDARGHGLSGTSGKPQDYRWDNQARSLWEVADHFTDDRIILGGREGKAGGYRITANVVKYTRGLPFRLLGRVPFRQSESFRRNARGVMARDLAQVRPEGVVGAMRGAALSDFPAREALARLEIPALILAWPDDSTHPLVVAEELNRILPNSRLEVARRESDPYAWSGRVRDFIRSLYPCKETVTT
jgi:pimeloyl-ACP methyl ester carboxylesterase